VTIEQNEIHDVALLESDMGGTYFPGSWADYGNTFRYNFIHHAKGANNLYFDDGESGPIAYGNILYGVISGSLVGGGHHVRLVNNLLVKTSGAAISIDNRGISRGYTVTPPGSQAQDLTALGYAQPPSSTAFDTLGFGATVLFEQVMTDAWHPEYPNGCQAVGNVVVAAAKGIQVPAAPSGANVTVSGTLTLAGTADAQFFDEATSTSERTTLK
jgi:hypothetical protein